MTGGQNARLSIFETFKTQKGKLTARAWRQRSIIRILAESPNPAERTRSAISRSIAASHGAKWQSAYPGVFKDMEETMVPLGLIMEEGRLPMKRGPRAMQEQGSPFYSLTPKGLVVALSMQEIDDRDALLEMLLEGNHVVGAKMLRALAERSPSFVYTLMHRYVEAWCASRFELMPFDLSKLAGAGDEFLAVQLELLRSFLVLDEGQKKEIIGFLTKIAGEA